MSTTQLDRSSTAKLSVCYSCLSTVTRTAASV